MSTGDIDLCCPCKRDLAKRRRTKHPTDRARIQFRSCGHVAHAINLRWDIWPMFADCPTCGEMSFYEFLRTDFRGGGYTRGLRRA